MLNFPLDSPSYEEEWMTGLDRRRSGTGGGQDDPFRRQGEFQQHFMSSFFCIEVFCAADCKMLVKLFSEQSRHQTYDENRRRIHRSQFEYLSSDTHEVESNSVITNILGSALIIDFYWVLY
jgi:hypothetical protein